MAEDVTFRDPPVVETVLGIQFDRMRGLTNAHFGAFWQEKRPEWPQVADAPPLVEQFETFGKQPGWSRAIQLQLTQTPASRVQIRNAAGDRMIQLQNCRLDYNWIGQPRQEYPRYRTVRPEFDAVLDALRTFVAECDLGTLAPNQWEVTYVNHFPRGTVWNEPAEWPALFRSLPGLAAAPAGLCLEGFEGHWHYEVEPESGRLHVELQHAHVGEGEEKEVLAMKLTARGPIRKGDDPDKGIDAGLNLGHDVIVRSFRDLTSEQAHAYWNRETSDAAR